MEFKTKKDRKAKSENNRDAEPEKLKIYILTVTCALTKHTTFEVCENRTYETTKLALQRVFFERGTPRVMISDSEPSFKAVARDFGSRYTNISHEEIQEAKDTINWLDGWKKSKENKI